MLLFELLISALIVIFALFLAFFIGSIATKDDPFNVENSSIVINTLIGIMFMGGFIILVAMTYNLIFK